MIEHGWKFGYAWCAYFSEFVWSEVYDSLGFGKQMDRLFSGSATKTLRQFDESEDWIVSTVPVVGAVVVWCHMKGGREQWQGHAGIVTEVQDGHMRTVEGNTNAAGSREGEVIAKKIRKYNFNSNSGLRLKGFVYPPGVVPHVPFNNNEDGDKFRVWVNDNHSGYAKSISLDRKGSYFNSFISKAWEKLGSKYSV
jgi:hypothetical protein